MITLQRIICSTLSLLLFSACSFFGLSEPDRVVRVKVLADSKLRETHPRWREETASLVEAASDHFENDFGIRFLVVKVEPLPQTDKITSTQALLIELNKLSPREGEALYDLLIGFTGERLPVYGGGGRARVDRIGNCRVGLGRYVAASFTAPFHYRGPNSDPSIDVIALIHELGHIFGAEHNTDPLSIMNENFDYRSDFDRASREIIFRNKFCPFAKSPLVK